MCLFVGGLEIGKSFSEFIFDWKYYSIVNVGKFFLIITISKILLIALMILIFLFGLL